MIDISSETVLPLREAAKLLPRRRQGRPVHASTLHRWASRGIKGVRLETIRIGGVRCTSPPALQRFFDQLTRATTTEELADNSVVKLDQSDVDRNLDEAGW